MAWQPVQSPHSSSTDERLLASGGDDGAIFIWNALALEGKPKCSMTMGPPIVALAFTPDGAFLAGATHERILIWKVGENSVPRASWSRAPHPGWLSPRMNPESDEEDEHCLGWDSTGHKLAYGVNSRVSCIFPTPLGYLLANELSLRSLTSGDYIHRLSFVKIKYLVASKR